MQAQNVAMIYNLLTVYFARTCGYASGTMGDSRALILTRVRALVMEHNTTPSQLATIAKKSRPWATSVLKGERNFTLPTADRVLEHFGESVQVVRGTKPVTLSSNSGSDPQQVSHGELESAIGVLREQRKEVRVALLEIQGRLSRLLERELVVEETGRTQPAQAGPRGRA